jgi:four helix bundle protein
MNYRTTRIYRCSLELIDFVARVVRRTPPGYGFLVDQIRRSAASVTLNYLEGCGRSGVAERRRFFTISIGSALEVSGTLEVMLRFGILPAADLTVGQDLCDHLAAMLRRFR